MLKTWRKLYNRRLWRTPLIGVLALLLLRASWPAAATEYSGTEFKVIDPVISVGGASVTSTTYTVLSSFGQVAVGTSTSQTYRLRSGFGFFPIATTPTLTATAGAEQVSLSWTASTGALGWTVTSYDVCRGTSSNSYTCSDVGNVTSNTVTGLTAGTTYYFRVRAKTTFGVVIVRSGEVSATPTSGGVAGEAGNVGVPAAPSPSAPPAAPSGGVVFSGKAYPRGTVTLLKDAQIAATAIADNNADWRITLNSLTPGTYLFGLYGEDTDGLRSNLLPYSLKIVSGETLTVSNILIPPTLFADKSEVKKGEELLLTGQSAPGAEVTISVSSERSDKEELFRAIAARDGRYSYALDTTELAFGIYIAKAKATLGSVVSRYGAPVGFEVGEKTVLAPPAAKCSLRADFNGDCRVNLIDFSILIYWFDVLNPPARIDLSGDGVVDLVDFSVMAYWWTG